MFTVMQNGIGDVHEEMLSMTAAHHYAWARRHGYIFEAYYGRQFEGEHHPYWEKLKLVLRWMKASPRGAQLVFLDPDVVVLRPWFSPSEMLPAWATLSLAWVKDCHRINFGVFAVRNHAETEAFLQKVVDLGSYDGACFNHDEGRIMYELGIFGKPARPEPFEMFGMRIHWLEAKWNRYAHNRSAEPVVIRGWHGHTPKSGALAEMQAEMEVLARNGYCDPNAA